MFHVEHCTKTQMITIRIWVFCIFLQMQMIIILNWLFPIFWRPRACAKVKYFFECYPEMCDQLGNQGHSLYFGAGAPVVVRRRFASDAPRRLYSARTNLSSLFCDPEHIRATIFRLLKKAPKTVLNWRRLYSTPATLSSTIWQLLQIRGN